MYASISFQPVECGHFVAVREKIDGTYFAFRGQILDEIKDKVKIKVFLVDFGDTIEVREKDIRPLPQEFASFPQFAVPCCLKNVEPLQGKVFFRAMFCLLAVLSLSFCIGMKAFLYSSLIERKGYFVSVRVFLYFNPKVCKRLPIIKSLNFFLNKKNHGKCPSSN